MMPRAFVYLSNECQSLRQNLRLRFSIQTILCFLAKQVYLSKSRVITNHLYCN